MPDTAVKKKTVFRSYAEFMDECFPSLCKEQKGSQTLADLNYGSTNKSQRTVKSILDELARM